MYMIIFSPHLLAWGEFIISKHQIISRYCVLPIGGIHKIKVSYSSVRTIVLYFHVWHANDDIITTHIQQNLYYKYSRKEDILCFVRIKKKYICFSKLLKQLNLFPGSPELILINPGSVKKTKENSIIQVTCTKINLNRKI